MPWTEGVYEATYQAGQTFVDRPGEYMQVGNAAAGNSRILATALLPAGAPLTIYQDGFTSSAYPTLTDWNYTHDIVVPAPGPTTTYGSAIQVDGAWDTFELVQLVLELSAAQPRQIVAGDEGRDGCLATWVSVSSNLLDVRPYDFERVAANLCVSSAYVPVSGPSRS